MTKKTPKPRDCNYLGMRSTAHTADNGTWLEPEELCYPNGGMTRRAYATCEDGANRLVRCGIPDTFFSIPGSTTIKGKTVKGYVKSDEEGYKFVAYAPKGEKDKAKDAKPAIQYYTHAHNVEDCLKNGSFVRGRQGKLARYMNGDFMGFVDAVPEGMTEVAVELAYRLLPKCCK